MFGGLRPSLDLLNQTDQSSGCSSSVQSEQWDRIEEQLAPKLGRDDHGRSTGPGGQASNDRRHLNSFRTALTTLMDVD